MESKASTDTFLDNFPDTPCKEACSPDPGESGRKDVRQEPTDEFFCRQHHRFPGIGGTFVILMSRNGMLQSTGIVPLNRKSM